MKDETRKSFRLLSDLQQELGSRELLEALYEELRARGIAEVEDELALMELAEAEAANAAYVAESVSFWMDECIDAYEELEYLRRELAEAEYRLAEAEMMLDWWNEKEVA